MDSDIRLLKTSCFTQCNAQRNSDVGTYDSLGEVVMLYGGARPKCRKLIFNSTQTIIKCHKKCTDKYFDVQVTGPGMNVQCIGEQTQMVEKRSS
jgi:hypothetical protein